MEMIVATTIAFSAGFIVRSFFLFGSLKSFDERLAERKRDYQKAWDNILNKNSQIIY